MLMVLKRPWMSTLVAVAVCVVTPVAQSTSPPQSTRPREPQTAALAATKAAAAERVNFEMVTRIRDEAQERSHIMRSLHFLTDVHGPRLTGSPAHKAAAEWAIRQMREWGFDNAHLEPWDFGRPGWKNDRVAAHIVSPVQDALTVEVLAWTPGTNGTVTAEAFQIAPPEQPTQTELEAYLSPMKDLVKGKIVLVGAPRPVSVNFTPSALRRDDQQLRTQYDPNNPNAGQQGPPVAAASPGSPQQGNRPQAQQPEQRPGALSRNALEEQIQKFLLSSGALVRVNDSGRPHGQIIAFGNRTYDPAQAIPTVVMRNEDYGRIVRLLGDRTPVQLEFAIVNRFFPEGRTSYNAVAEIRGTDKSDEVVMLGGHLDSWHAATGATDNAIGCAMMMEAARILKVLGVKPRRTIRVALWSGEEQGLLGSQAYVKEHFGSFEDPKPEFQKLSAYLNIDSGTGRPRGASVFGPPETATILRHILAAFPDLGVVGAVATRSRRVGGTDSTSFNNAGLPGVGFGQDPIEYSSHTHHTNLDTYERIVEDDVKKGATVLAGVLYHLAMRDEMLPRFSKTDMPPPVMPQTPARTTSGQ